MGKNQSDYTTVEIIFQSEEENFMWEDVADWNENDGEESAIHCDGKRILRQIHLILVQKKVAFLCGLCYNI